MFNKKMQQAFVLFLSLMVSAAGSQGQVAREKIQQIKTYPFSDPNPVPSMAVNNNIARFYPYFMFDAYSKNGKPQNWKVVTLENDHVIVTVLPEVGGKVYGAIEKSTNQEFVYLNEVMKFRAIGSRGPWTSGGIEHNFGLDIGHAPWAASPVDYIIRKKPDGTAECIVGGLDLASRTQWRVNISLPANSAFFETKALWYNPTPYHHSYLSWENAAYKATEDLEFFFPGNYHIDHDGSARPWPIDENGRDISKYKNNIFGSSKSYHVMGDSRNWFGGLWQDSSFGFGHWAPYSDAPGKKLWIWSLSRDGAIWEDLLTDNDGQYIEAQSGVKFNQADVVSGYHSPFKQLYLRPGYCETKYEVWFPVKGVKGMNDATPAGTLHVTNDNNTLQVTISPNVDMRDSLIVRADGKTLHAVAIELQVMKPIVREFTVPHNAKNISVRTIKSKLVYSSADKFIQRPVKSPDNYEPDDAERLFLLAEDKNSMRLHHEAMNIYRQCLEKEPSHVGALTRMAELLYRKTEDDSAVYYAKKALSINTYDGAANYIYGIIEKRSGNLIAAEEAMSVALRSLEFRSEAYRQLAELALIKKEFTEAMNFSKAALEYNQRNIPAHQILCVAQRKSDLQEDAQQSCEKLLDIDPLNHFARFEIYLQNKTDKSKAQFTAPIQNEFPHESYLELAVNYAMLQLTEEATRVLELSPPHPMVNYWLAYLHGGVAGDDLLTKANAMSAEFVFPFREESIPVLEYAISRSGSWKANYYLALIYWSKGATNRAIKLLEQCGNEPNFTPFYLSRAFLGNDKEKDFRKAQEIEPGEWRTSQFLAEYLSDKGMFDEAVAVWEKAIARHPGHVIVNLGYAQALLNQGKYEQCLAILKKVYVLPQEHANQGHNYYENANIALALEKIKARQWNKAIAYLNDAKKWPEHLGSGEPYDADNRLTNLLLSYCEERKGNKARSQQLKKEIVEFTLKTWPRANKISGNYIGLAELMAAGQKNQADKLLDVWKHQTDSLQKWGLPGGAGGIMRNYMLLKLQNSPKAYELEQKILADKHAIANRLFIEAVRIVYNEPKP